MVENPGQPPIDVAIDSDPVDLRQGAIFALRATIRRTGELMFTTDTVTRLLTDGESRPVEVRLRSVRQWPRATPRPVSAPGLRLPASFRGVLPRADCEGIRHHLDFWPDQYYHRPREWQGRTDGTLRHDEIGRWHADTALDAIVLFGAAEMPLFWQVKGPDRLRRMDMAGNPIKSDRPHDLTGDGTLEPTDFTGMFLLGIMTYLADAVILLASEDRTVAEFSAVYLR